MLAAASGLLFFKVSSIWLPNSLNCSSLDQSADAPQSAVPKARTRGPSPSSAELQAHLVQLLENHMVLHGLPSEQKSPLHMVQSQESRGRVEASESLPTLLDTFLRGARVASSCPWVLRKPEIRTLTAS